MTETIKFQMFRGTFTSWRDLFQQAADYASKLPPGALINISHSAEHGGHGVVVVWYRK